MISQAQQLKLLLKQEQKDLAKIRAIQQKVSGECSSETEGQEFEHIELAE